MVGGTVGIGEMLTQSAPAQADPVAAPAPELPPEVPVLPALPALPVLPPQPDALLPKTHSKPLAQSESVLHSLALAVPTVTVEKKAAIAKEMLVKNLDAGMVLPPSCLSASARPMPADWASIAAGTREKPALRSQESDAQLAFDAGSEYQLAIQRRLGQVVFDRLVPDVRHVRVSLIARMDAVAEIG
jgi:hypothetical protein